jgi:iron complex transport system substrate-binding protein
MLRKLLLSCLLVLILWLSACAPAVQPTPTPASITLTDALGRSISLATPAQRIVSIAPSNTEILFAIGAGAQIVGRDQASDFPEDAKKITNIGGSDMTAKLNTEAILALQPDLVLAGSLNPPEQIKALEDLGIVVFTLPNPLDLDEMYTNLRTTAQLTGHEAEAETLIQSLQARVKVVSDKLSTIEEKPLVFYEIDSTDAKAPWTPGPGNFIDTMIVMAGGRNVGAILKDQWAQISLEELVKQDPDVIILGDAIWGGVTPELVKQRAGWDAMKAVKNDKIFPFDDSLLSRPGPRLVDGLETLAKLIHPDVFK